MFSQTAEYALRAMAWLALTKDERVASSTLAENTQVPPDYLAKVLQLLAKAKLIAGRRGVGGGYQLLRDPSEIRLLDVVNAVEPLTPIESCPLSLKDHKGKLCPLHRKVDQATRAVIEIFDDATLADLINEPGASTPLCSEETIASLTIDRKQ